eukprot:2832152-Prymnesium_polylepis.1
MERLDLLQPPRQDAPHVGDSGRTLRSALPEMIFLEIRSTPCLEYGTCRLVALTQPAGTLRTASAISGYT